MEIIALILLIPVFSVGFVLYMSTIYDFITTGKFNELLFIISSALTVISSYYLPSLFVSILKFNNIKFLNNKNKILVLSYYFSLILLIILGISFLYNGLIHTNYSLIILGIGIIFIFIYNSYIYLISYEEDSFILDHYIENNNYTELVFRKDDYYISYYVKENKYKEGNNFIIVYNKYTNVIKRINGMVLGGDIYEKNNKEKHKKK